MVLCNSGILPAVDLIGDHVLVGVSLLLVPECIAYSYGSLFKISCLPGQNTLKYHALLKCLFFFNYDE